MRLSIAKGILGVLAVSGASGARAQGPQELEQLEPGGGELQLEYQGLYGLSHGDAGDTHSLGLGYGVSDRLVLGIEAEGETERGGVSLDRLEISALYHVAPMREGAFGLGLKLSGAADKAGRFAEAEARVIAERIGPRWWLQGNVMIQHEREDGNGATSLAYVGNASRAVADNVWLGAETSGNVARISGSGESERSHFAGPSATMELEFGRGPELEVGLVYSVRISGLGPANSVRLFAQLEF